MDAWEAAAGGNCHQHWILKPAGFGGGGNITLLTNEEIRAWRGAHFRELYVAQAYVMKPLLVGGIKFDIRLYVVVKSFGDINGRPPEMYLFREGICRLT